MFNGFKVTSVIAYLLLKPERAHAPREIYEQLYPDEVKDLAYMS